MNNTRNHRINQVTENTLIIGIDIAKKTHYACAVDYRGIELHKAYAIKQSRDGFERFLTGLSELQSKHEKEDILVGFEPTGHYWMNLAAFLTEHNIRFVMVNPMHVNRTKELDDNLQTKNDQKDARVIAKLMTNGNFSFPRHLDGAEAELREGSSARHGIKKNIALTKNRIIRWIDRYFPEFSIVYKGLGKNACIILKQTPLPTDLLENDLEDLIALYKEKEDFSYLSKPKLKRLMEMAPHSIGMKTGTDMARIEIMCLIDQFTLFEEQLEVINTQLTAIAKQLTDYEFLISIPGISENTVTELLAETGSLTQYNNPRQLIKLAGLTLRENSSGQHKGQKHISKRGRRKLRSLLYRATLPLLHNNKVFYELYQYYITREINPLKKKEAMVVLCSKLLKVFHGLSRNQIEFNPKKMARDITGIKPNIELAS